MPMSRCSFIYYGIENCGKVNISPGDGISKIAYQYRSPNLD